MTPPPGEAAKEPRPGSQPEEPVGGAALVAAGAEPQEARPGSRPEGPEGDAALVAAGAEPPSPPAAPEPPRRRFAWLAFADTWWYWAAGAVLWLVLGLIGTGWFRYAAFALAVYDGAFAVLRYRGGPRRRAGASARIPGGDTIDHQDGPR
ncbi:MAG: hypothetical protein ABR564_09950 [Candidatus Dormibacteria bacterium]